MLDSPDRPAHAVAARLDARFGALSAADIVAAMVHDVFAGRIALVSSFGADSAAMLSLVAEVAPELPVLFLQTGKHFDQTLAHRQDLAARLGLTNVIDLYPEPLALRRRDPSGLLHRTDPDTCCEVRKAHPLNRALAGFDAWFTGRRRHQTFARRAMRVMEADGPRLKINPIARWDQADVDAFIEERALPRHPLVAAGYPSIGCEPCTKRPDPGEDARAGRWQDSEKTECGIHWMQ